MKRNPDMDKWANRLTLDGMAKSYLSGLRFTPSPCSFEFYAAHFSHIPTFKVMNGLPKPISSISWSDRVEADFVQGLVYLQKSSAQSMQCGASKTLSFNPVAISKAS